MGDHGHHHSPGEDLAIARSALASDDLGHAAFHVACALAVDARHPEALALADQVLTKAPDPRALCKVEADTYFGVVAFHARALAHIGERGDAAKLLSQVIAIRPEVGYATWLAPWLGAVDADSAAVAIERAQRGLAEASEGARAEMIAAGARALDAHPEDERVACMHARLLRTCGRIDDALALLRAADARHRSYLTGVVLATTHRIAGDRATAVEHLRDLCARFADDDAVFLDLGDNLLDLDRAADAADAYQHVVARQPHHDWAQPSLYYAKFLATGESTWRDQLEDLAQIESARRARDLARSVTPYVGYLPMRPEAVLKVGEQLRQSESPPSGELAMALSSLEAPSAVAALARHLATHGALLELSCQVPDPDPRVPRQGVAFPTWRYEDTRATPAMAAPPAKFADALATIAATRFDGGDWTEHAHRIAGELGPDAAGSIIAAMVHGTSQVPSWASPWGWLWRLQAAGALVLANLDPGWDDSVRRRALLSLIDGPVDWLASAGLFALARVCDRDPAFVPIATPILEAAADHAVTPIHHMCLITPAIHLLCQLPGASPAQRERRRARRAALD